MCTDDFATTHFHSYVTSGVLQDVNSKDVHRDVNGDVNGTPIFRAFLGFPAGCLLYATIR